MLIKLTRHYVATSQRQRWNRIWVTTDTCYNVILTLHLISSHSFPYFLYHCVGVHHILIYYFKKKNRIIKRSCRSKNQCIFTDAQFHLIRLKTYNTTSYNANIQVKIKVQWIQYFFNRHSTRTITRMRKSHTCTLLIQVWHLFTFFAGPFWLFLTFYFLSRNH